MVRKTSNLLAKYRARDEKILPYKDRSFSANAAHWYKVDEKDGWITLSTDRMATAEWSITFRLGTPATAVFRLGQQELQSLKQFAVLIAYGWKRDP